MTLRWISLEHKVINSSRVNSLLTTQTEKINNEKREENKPEDARDWSTASTQWRSIPCVRLRWESERHWHWMSMCEGVRPLNLKDLGMLDEEAMSQDERVEAICERTTKRATIRYLIISMPSSSINPNRFFSFFPF